jgi:hypothetical protein
MSCPCPKCRPVIADETWATIQGVSVIAFLTAIGLVLLAYFAPPT